MEKTIILIALVSLSSCLCEGRHAGIKQTQALDHLYKIKKSPNSTIDTSSHFEPSLFVNKLASVVLPQEGLKNKDKIHKFPGQPYVRFDQYGGYVTIDESDGRALYYYFVEAVKAKESLPLLLWLNGGPGCSSVGYGAMRELGPFRVNSDGQTLHRNRFAWNHAANVLFLESPAGVGFSYSNQSDQDESYNFSDYATAADNYVFLLNWLERFPEYKGREFYIAGESYAGHYVPQLAQTILHNNKMANKTLINLKGILIGNAAINDPTDIIGMYDYHQTHALMSDETNEQIHKYCDFSEGRSKMHPMGPIACDDADRVAQHNIAYIDLYNIYAPVCVDGNLTSRPKPMSQVIDPCIDFYTNAYMNRADVQEAIHANVTKLDYDWQACSGYIFSAWLDSPTTVIPVLKELMEINNLRVWIYSGDTDGRLPVTSTKYSITSMNLSIKTPWHPWLDHQGEMGGYAEVREGDLTFATVRGAGHHVPSDKPRISLALVKHFLTGTPLKDTLK
uniref:serine carboxypeptidase-like 40 n=1 Tax=Erigeron canadensis TaxID=72917 RepID=UPI001CB8B238|nr:serine carboxypeptidase-like 40 [Erigeron canadensis]